MSREAVARWVFLAPVLAAFAAAAPSAEPLAAQAACTAGATRCEQNRFQRCQRGRWITVETCGAGQSCNATAGCAATPVQRPPAAMQRVPSVQRQAPSVQVHDVIRQPGMLSCPGVPHNTVALPAPPYDEALGDCALRGKTGLIDEWLSALESIAAACQSRRAGYWQTAEESHGSLLAQIDELPLPPEPSAEAELYMQPMELGCAPYPGGAAVASGGLDPPSRDGWAYTDWLKRIGENVLEYCDLVDRLIEPVHQACEEINYRLGCESTSEARKASYRGLLDGKWNAAQVRYGYTDFLYTHTLAQYGWQNFRAYFNEGAIRCTTQIGGLR